jgi:protein gp37
MSATTIEWTDETWNPTTGCDRVSPGCDHCYALPMAKRIKAMEASRIDLGLLPLSRAKYQTDGDPRTSGPGFGIAMHPRELATPLTWSTPRKVFVNSMSDLFHDGVSDEFLAQVFAVMAATPQHTYQILTKRHGRMRSLLSRDEFRVLTKDKHVEMQLVGTLPYRPLVINSWPLKNVWLGVSVEDQQRALLRIPALLDTPAAVRWISAEPLIGPLDFRHEWLPTGSNGKPHLDWVVVGGESGHGARPVHPAWVRSIRDECTSQGIPFWFKQWGSWGPAPWRVERLEGESVEDYKTRAEATCATHAYAVWANDYGHQACEAGHKPWSAERTSLDGGSHAPIRRWGKKASGCELDGRKWAQFPERVA